MLSSGDQDGADPDGQSARNRTLQQALELACAHLNRRDRTVAEIRAQLERKGVSQSLIAEAIAQLVELRLVDDERFAERYVADKRGLERWGTERIRRGLARRGIEPEVAEPALAAETAAGDPLAGDPSVSGDSLTGGDPSAGGDPELGRALDLLRRRFPQPPQDRRNRDRALGMLLRKGYQHELAIDALNAHAHGE